MTSEQVRRGRKTKLKATKKKSFQSSDIDVDTLPSWNEVQSDDSLNDFIVDKTPVLSGKRRLWFDSSDDDDDDEMQLLQATPVTSTSGKFKTSSRFKRGNTSVTPYRGRINTHISDILIPELSSCNEKKSTVKTKKRRSINEIFDKLVKDKNISTEAEKRERFLKHVTNKIQKLDRIDLNLTEMDLGTATPSRKKDFVAETPVTTQKIPSSKLRRSGRVRKSVGIKRPSCVITDSHSSFIKRVQDQIPPPETVNLENLQKSLKTPKKTPNSSSKTPKDTSKEKALKQGRSLRVVLHDCFNKSPPPKDDNVPIKTGRLQLKPKKGKQLERLVHQEALYTVFKGRASVVINGVESVVEREGEFMVREGDDCFVRNLEEHSNLVVHYCVIG